MFHKTEQNCYFEKKELPELDNYATVLLHEWKKTPQTSSYL